MIGFRIVVIGWVQGVGFRAFTMRTAASFGILGEVWNRTDGRVEALAYSTNSEILLEFANKLRSGPGCVIAVETSPTVDASPSEFEVTSTR